MKDLTRFFKLFFCVLLIFCFVSLTAYAGGPNVINYHGRLTGSNDVLLDGMCNVTFRIYDAPSGGDLKWEETQSVNFENGIFNILLGGFQSLNVSLDRPCWLAIKVGNESERTEREQLFKVESFISGVITMWSGSADSVPNGWVLCNGLNGTPDLTSRFVVGAGSSYSVGQSGGSETHTHTATCGQGDNVWQVADGSGGDDWNCAEKSHTHTITVNSENKLPPYYALAYIMKL